MREARPTGRKSKSSTKPKPFHHSRSEGLNEDISHPAELVHNFRPLWVLQVDGKGALSSSCHIIVDPTSNLRSVLVLELSQGQAFKTLID